MSIRTLCACIIAAIAVAPAVSAQSSTPLNEFQQQVDNQLNDAEAVLAQEGYVQVERYIDQRGLSENESRDRRLQLDTNQDYVIAAVCDSDCSDLDLVLYAGSSEVARDTASDAYPVLTLRPQAQAHQIEVTMYGCEAAPCYFGFGVFRQRAPLR